ncbi:MAG: Transcriptional regulatory protein YycF, partial [Pseudomonadota bacterium]
ARTLGTHNKRLNEVFRKCAGVTVFEYLREERMRQACISLADSVLNVQQIALALGFSSGANFATAFKDRFGLSPSDFRSGRGGSGPAFSLPATGAT